MHRNHGIEKSQSHKQLHNSKKQTQKACSKILYRQQLKQNNQYSWTTFSSVACNKGSDPISTNNMHLKLTTMHTTVL